MSKDEELLTAILVTQCRIYDALLYGLDKDKRDTLIAAHEAGDLIGPPIKYVRPDDSE